MKESVNWSEIENLTSRQRDRLAIIEKKLLDNPDGVFWENLCKAIDISDKEEPTRRRILQMNISLLNNIYVDGTPKISRGPIHKLNRTGYDLAFPEEFFNTNDRRNLNSICRLVAFFDGAVPIRSILKSTGIKMSELEEALNEFSETIDMSQTKTDIEYIKEFYDAIENRQKVQVTYPRLNNGNSFGFSPYMLKRYNNKWSVIGRMHVDNPHDWSVIPLSAITNLGQCKIGDFWPNEEEKLREIRGRIKSYYEKVIGFHVPTNEKDPDKVPREKIPESLPVEEIKLRFDSSNVRFVKENPIHPQQELDEETNILTLEVIINPLLIQKILSYGNKVEVLSPSILREQIKEIAEGLYNLYQS